MVLSVSYGLLSYVMAYLKHYYPVEFMTSLLMSEVGNYEQTAKYIDECRNMGIKVLPPSIKDSEPFYTVKDVNGVKSILFGFSAIKGMGVTTVEELLKIRKEISIDSLNDFIQNVKSDKTSTISLIKSGAFGKDNKNSILEELFNLTYEPTKYSRVKTIPTKKKMIELGLIKTDLEFKDKETCLDLYNNYKLTEYKKREKERKEKQFNIFSESYISDESMYEYETLSIFLNETPFEDYKDVFKPLTQQEGKEKLLIGGTITDIQRKKDKKGQQYAYLSILTVHDGIKECMAFASIYSEYKDIIKKGENIVVMAKPSNSQFIISKMITFENWKETVKRKREARKKHEERLLSHKGNVKNAK